MPAYPWARSAALTAFVGIVFMSSCSTEKTNPTEPEIEPSETFGLRSGLFPDRSVTPALVKNVLAGVKVTTLLSSDDVLPQTPKFVFGGSADGAGLIRTWKGFELLVNNEDNWSISKITLDGLFRPVGGEYIVNSDNGLSRLCSATLATPLVNGFGPVFLTAGESSVESLSRAVNPFGGDNTSTPLPAFGRWSAENTLPLPWWSYPGKTVVVIGDDDSGPFGGQIAVYISNRVGDLENGRLYVLARTDDNTREMDMVVGRSYPVALRQIPDQKSLTGAQLNQKAQELKALVLGRVEDLDYRKGGTGREIYFNVTGQNNTGVNADYSRSKYGRVYRYTMDKKDPLKGTIDVVLDGDNRSGIAGRFQNVDNITATDDYLYLMEDPNEYGDETHDSYLWQYNLRSKALKVVFEIDHRRDAPDAAKFNPTGPSSRGSWESSGMIDISQETLIPGTFMIAIQAHSWRGDKYLNPDGGSLRASENQASQLLILRGLPR